jgi:hypothetical protein
MTSAITHHGGRPVDLLHPRPGDFRIEVVARALAGKFRWCGAAACPGGHVTVAQHCIMVSDLLERWGERVSIQRAGLLHELDEVFLPDMPSPLKHSPEMAFWRHLAERHRKAGARAFGLLRGQRASETIHRADVILRLSEWKYVLGMPPAPDWNEGLVPLTDGVTAHHLLNPSRPEIVEKDFLIRYEYLTEQE